MSDFSEMSSCKLIAEKQNNKSKVIDLEPKNPVSWFSSQWVNHIFGFFIEMGEKAFRDRMNDLGRDVAYWTLLISFQSS